MFSGSAAIFADGAHTISDALISTIVWLGLKVSGRAPDGKFHYGYFRVETFSAVIAAFVLVGVGIVILVRSYFALLRPVEISNPVLPLVTAAAASGVDWGMGLVKRRIAKEEMSEALRLDSYNTMKSGLSSLFAFLGIFSATYFAEADALAGIGISFFVFVVAYTTVRESALVLMDACECFDVTDAIKSTAEGINGVKRVDSVRLRHSGPYIFGDLHIQVNGKTTVNESDKIIRRIKSAIKEIVPTLEQLTVEISSGEEEEE
ncbi:MAG: cation diffusion facilitator family transporter [Thaumarchaeota archaeon]|nr:cation diffusion facilitator family transporter [Nitrososphaerota archaeon]